MKTLQEEMLTRTHLSPTGGEASTGELSQRKAYFWTHECAPRTRCPVIRAQGWRQVWPCDLTAGASHQPRDVPQAVACAAPASVRGDPGSRG